MEGKSSSVWPIVLIIVAIGVAILAGVYFYPMEKQATGTGDLFATSTNNSMTDNQGKVLVTLKTNQGDIALELYPDKAPKTVANFVKLAQEGFYNGILFHRVIKGFMIQGGDPLSKQADWNLHGTGGPGYKFDDEQNDLGLARGIIAMANSGPNTNGSQFFIMTSPTPMQLAGYYTAFGRVVGDMSAVDKIEATSVNERDHPLSDMVIQGITIKN